MSDAWSAKVDPLNDETGLPVRYRSNKTEVISGYLIAPDGSAIAAGTLPYVRLEDQIIWGNWRLRSLTRRKRYGYTST